jgi:hypothetical protein
MMMVVSRYEMGQKILNPTLLDNLIEDNKIETVLRSNGTTSNGRSWDSIEEMMMERSAMAKAESQNKVVVLILMVNALVLS